MTIDNRAWEQFTRRMERIDAAAARALREWMHSHDYSTEAGIRNLIREAIRLNSRFGQAAAELACQMYDATAALYHAAVPAAQAAEVASAGDVAKAMRGVLGASSNEEMVSGALGALVKKAGLDTTIENARRDRAEIAWIPSGDACAFCIMLAARGWKKMTAGSSVDAHAHSHCRCTYSVRFGGSGGVRGYGPQTYKEIWEDAGRAARDWGGNTGREDRLNAIRRAQYAERADEINAQKREAYKKRMEAEEASSSTP